MTDYYALKVQGILYDGTNGQEIVNQLGGTFSMENGVLMYYNWSATLPVPTNVLCLAPANGYPYFIESDRINEVLYKIP